MATCTSCGNTVTGKKFCPDCGTPVQGTPNTRFCPQCQGEVRSDAAFCMHCGTALKAPAVPVVAPRMCAACHTQMDGTSAFCTQCGHDMRVSTLQNSELQCPQCGRHNAANMRFCGGCGSQLGNQMGSPVSSPAYQQQPYQYVPPQYSQPGYSQPMVGQQPMVLRCPTCMALAPVGSAQCVSCRTNLSGVVPMPANVPIQGQQGGMGGFLQGNGGKYAMGALGGAAAILGGEMLMHGVENQIEHRIEDNLGFGGHHHQRRDEDEGLLGGLGRLADDIGLI